MKIFEITEKKSFTNSLPDKIKPLGITKPIPQAPTGPDKTLENGTTISTDKNGNRTVSSGAGKYTFKDGKLITYVTPTIGGYKEVYDLVKKTITVDYGTTVTRNTGIASKLSKADREILKKNDPNYDKSSSNIDQKATYDMSGKLISKGKVSVGAGDARMTQDPNTGISDFEFGAGGLPGDAVGYKKFKISNDPADKGRSMSDYRDYEKHISVDPIAKRTGKKNPDPDKARVNARVARAMKSLNL